MRVLVLNVECGVSELNYIALWWCSGPYFNETSVVEGAHLIKLVANLLSHSTFPVTVKVLKPKIMKLFLSYSYATTIAEY